MSNLGKWSDETHVGTHDIVALKRGDKLMPGPLLELLLALSIRKMINGSE